MLVAPTELRHAPFRALSSSGRGSNRPEDLGCDFAFVHKSEWYGVQRKELKDFVASVADGRLATECRQMAACRMAILVIEGQPKWSLDGTLMMSGWGGRWTEDQHYKYLWSLAARGISSYGTSNTAGTARVVRHFEEWVKKPKHRALDARPGPVGNSYRIVGLKEEQRHMLQGVRGIGPEMADAILDAIGMPFGLVVSDEQLLSVPGVGPKTVKKMRQVFHSDQKEKEDGDE